MSTSVPSTKSTPRVLFLAADSCDPELVKRWAAAGELPFFARLLQTGLRARTLGPAGVYGGAIWPTFVTGVSPGRHRFYCFTQYSPQSYADERFRAEQLAEEPFWMRLDRAGRRIGVVDVPLAPLTQPANGIHVSEWAWHDLAGPRARFSSSAVGRDVKRVAGVAPVRNCEGSRSTAREYDHLRNSLVHQVKLRTRLAAHFLGQAPFDFFACVFCEGHCAGHQMWHIHDDTHPTHTPSVARGMGEDPLLDVYRAIDQGCATLASHADEDTIVAVWLSHGMGPLYDATFLLDDVLKRLEDPAHVTSRPALLSSARKFWRRIPFAWRNPFGAVTQAILPSFLPDVAADRRGRKYFAVPDNNEQGAIRINLIGRDAHGRVRPGAEYEQILAQLREALLELENADTGEPIVTGFQYPQLLHRGPYSNDLPDMTVEWDRSRPINRVRSQRLGLVETEPVTTRSGDHKPEGLLFVLHPGVSAGEIDRPLDVIDFAPTIASLLGVPLEGFDGRPIPELLATSPSCAQQSG